jgi:hypothetical protein
MIALSSRLGERYLMPVLDGIRYDKEGFIQSQTSLHSIMLLFLGSSIKSMPAKCQSRGAKYRSE